MPDWSSSSESNSGSLLSNVFTFVSRELESFVVNAAGRSSQTTEHASTSAQNLRVQSRPKSTKKTTTKTARTAHREDASTRTGRPPRLSPDPPRELTTSTSLTDNRRAKQRPRSLKKPPQPAAGLRTDTDLQHNDDTRRAHTLLRKPSVTMPGSLFSRSASPPDLHPDRTTTTTHNRDADADADDADNNRHVHFTPKSSSFNPRRRSRHRAEDSGSGSGSGSGSDDDPRHSRKTGRRSLPSPPSPPRLAESSTVELRPRTIPSVKEVVQRFCADEDAVNPSLLLPISPTRMTTTRTASQMAAGDAATDVGGGRRRGSRSSLGEQHREEERDSDEEFSFGSGYQTSPSRRLDKGKQREYDSVIDHSGRRSVSEIAVRGKERELVAAREEHDRNERRREQDRYAEEAEEERRRDKERIRCLEREIAQLKEELSKRPSGSARGNSAALHYPPPPPPPPPPPAPPPLGVGVTNPTSRTDALFESARAALRQTGMPVEAPINPGTSSSRTKRQGQPTVNVPSDKMAAFLNEVKTAKLRKVGSMQGLSRSKSDAAATAQGSGVLLRRASAGATVHHAGIARTLNKTLERNEQDVRIGEKRKRSEQGDIIGREAPSAKRRSPVPSISRAAPFPSTSLNFPLSNSTSFSRSHPSSSSAIHGANRTWPSISITTETDLTTPSLCSDNDVERADDGLPMTPPDTQGASKRPVKPRPPREVIDVDMDDDGVTEVIAAPQPRRALPPPSRLPLPVARTPPPLSDPAPGVQKSPHARKMSDILAKRPPTSPMPNSSPRKPRPPKRASAVRNSTALSPVANPTEGGDASDGGDEDELPVMTSSAAVSVDKDNNGTGGTLKTGSSMCSRSQPSSSRRPNMPSTRSKDREGEPELPTRKSSSRRWKMGPTLDEEFRDAGENDGDVDLDSGVLVGVGMKDKRGGFLAHGGAGGVPVFMGVGYVEGEEDMQAGDDASDVEYQPRRRRISNRRQRWRSSASVDD